MTVTPFKADLLDPPHTAYLNTAAEGLLLASALDGLHAYARDKGRGEPGRAALFATADRVREQIAGWLGVAAADVTFGASTSDLLSSVLLGLGLVAGDRVIMTDLEYPAGALPLLRLRETGVGVQVIQSRAGSVTLTDLEAALAAAGSSGVKQVVVASLVSFKTGFKYDLAALRALTRRYNALLVIDAIQALGATQVPAHLADVVVAGTYKWLLGTHGLAVIYCRPELQDQVQPGHIGWRSVDDAFGPSRFEQFRWAKGIRRFETGMPPFPGMYVLERSLAYLDTIGPERILARVQSLGDQLIHHLVTLGVPMLTPVDGRQRAGVFSFTHSEARKIVAALQDQGVQVFAPVDDVVRISVHFYNDSDDIERCVKALQSVLRGDGQAR